MFERIAHLTIRFRKAILVVFPIIAIAAGLYGSTVSAHLSQGGFDHKASESAHAAELLKASFGSQQPAVVLLVTARGGNVDSDAVAARAASLTKRVEQLRGIRQVVSYWQAKAVGWGELTSLKSRDSTMALIIGVPKDAKITNTYLEMGIEALKLESSDDLVDVHVGGTATTYHEINVQTENDLLKAEVIAIPITLVLLVVVFGGVVAALLPLGVASLSIFVTTGFLRFVAERTEVSIFAMNLTTMMGLGLAIDYCLFVVGRYREELRTTDDPLEAAHRTVLTAGRTVAFSSLVIGASLSASLVFPIAFLRSFAWVGIGIAITCALAGMVFLPALLAVLGPRVNSLSFRKRPPKEVGEGIWHRQAQFVMRRPIPVIVAIVAILLILGSPFLGVKFGVPDDRVLPPQSNVRVAQDQIREHFDGDETSAYEVVVPKTESSSGEQRLQDLARYGAALSRVDHVGRVDGAFGIYRDGRLEHGPDLVTKARFGDAASATTWISVIPEVDVLSETGSKLTDALRSAPSPFDEHPVTGVGASFKDGRDGVIAKIPLALGIIATSTFVLLFLMFGSVLIPIKALFINVLSLSATFGSVVYIFQDGHFSKFFNFTATGTLPTTVPVLMFCIAFGLSMDYEVFLISRIKEQHDAGADNITSVAVGLEQSGRIVSAAAILISVVFVAFATAGVSFVKAFGVGLSLAVLLDAFVIRGTLVPAFMRLAGGANWWAPKWMTRIYQRAGMHH